MFFPDEKKIALASGKKIIILDAITHQLIATLEGHTEPVNTVALSSDGSKIVSGSNDKTIKIWDAITHQLIATLEGHTGRVSTVALSSDGSKIVSGSADKTIKIWDAITHQLISTLFDDTDNNSLFRYHSFTYDGGQILLSPDGDYLTACSSDNEVTSLNPNALNLWKNYTERPDALLRNVKNLESQETEAESLQGR